jgi:hypothetical protein
MGELSRRVARYGATLALVMLLGVFGAYAEDDPFAPLQNRIRPPIGVTAQGDNPTVPAEEGLLVTFWTWLRVQLQVSLPLG